MKRRAIIWRQTPEEGGSIGYWGNVKGEKYLCFCVWINARESGKQWQVDLCAWTDGGDDPSVSQVIRLPAKWTMEQALEMVPRFKVAVVGMATDHLEERTALVRSLLEASL